MALTMDDLCDYEQLRENNMIEFRIEYKEKFGHSPENYRKLSLLANPFKTKYIRPKSTTSVSVEVKPTRKSERKKLGDAPNYVEETVETERKDIKKLVLRKI